ncbi:MAG: hypothetical protein R3B40_21695 [Polyangiales bacterium]
MSTVESPSDANLSVSAPGQSDAAAGGSLLVPAWLAVIVFLVGATVGHIYVHYAAHGVVNVHQAVLAFFLVLNVLINFWELGLFFCGDRIHEEYEATKVPYKGREGDRCKEVFTKRIPFFQLLSFKQWTLVWSSYALYDPGYAQRHSFGFNIDVGNGFSTIIPATLFAFGMTYDLVSPQILGIIGVAMFWQMFYGTVVYFFQFFHSGRHHGHSKAAIWLFVGASNGMWFIFPLWGIAVSVWMILNNSMAILH